MMSQLHHGNSLQQYGRVLRRSPHLRTQKLGQFWQGLPLDGNQGYEVVVPAGAPGNYNGRVVFQCSTGIL